MSLSIIDIKEGAFFISDAHYSASRPELYDFLKDIDSKVLQPSQLIFMGDIFDALFGGVPRTYTENQQVIDLIDKLSLEIEVVYLEGNHDFNLKKVFENAKVFSIDVQPISCDFNGKKVYLAHGDFTGTLLYKVYTAVVRTKAVLALLNILNILLNNSILNRLEKYLSKKKDCTDIKTFEQIIKNRLDTKYECEYFVEGHFHQNKFIKYNGFKYFNLAAFACNQRYFIVKSSHEELFVERKFSKGT